MGITLHVCQCAIFWVLFQEREREREAREEEMVRNSYRPVFVCLSLIVCSHGNRFSCREWRRQKILRNGKIKKIRYINVDVLAVKLSLFFSSCDVRVWFVKFHLEQARLRSRIRIETGRGKHFWSEKCWVHVLCCSSPAKPIDLLAKYINTSEEDVDIEMQEPYHLLRVCLLLLHSCMIFYDLCLLLQGLNIIDLEDLLEDIRVYLELEKDVHFDYWKVCNIP